RQAAKPELAHRRLAAGEGRQVRELLATGEDQAAVMRLLGHLPDERRIAFIPLTVASLEHPLLKERFQVVEHQQTAPLLQELDEEGECLFVLLRKVSVVLLGKEP